MEIDMHRDSSCTSRDSLLEEYMTGIVMHPKTKKAILSRREWLVLAVSFVASAAMAFAAGTLFRPSCASTSLVGTDINHIVPQFPIESVKFDFRSTDEYIPGPKDSNVSFAVWKKWTAMLPVGNGVVDLPDHADFEYLTTPIKPMTPEQEGSSIYSMAWTHQLHCLYFVMKEYHRVLHHGPDGSEYYIDPTHNSYHASHCFNYLRQAILCSLDSTLEGAGEGSGSPDGSGQTHVCRSHAHAVAWLEANKFDTTHEIDELE